MIFLLSFIISIINSVLLLIFSQYTSGIAMFITFFVSFLFTYLLVWLSLEFIFFKQLNTLTVMLRKTPSNDVLLRYSKNTINPLKKIIEEISRYIKNQEQEIKKLKYIENFRREFIADISHELKTPIFSAQGFVLTLLDGAIHDKEVRKKFLKKAAKSLRSLDLLVEDILTISQIESGEIRMHIEKFDINSLCEEIIEQLEERANKNVIKLKLNKLNTPVLVKGDYRRIYQVMLNLISNGIKYSTEHKSVMVSFEDLDQKIRVCVTDKGIGIHREHLSRIFERFYRVEKSRSRENGGTGLGLSIVKHILESHNSEIHVESQPKKGSKFYFDLEKALPLEQTKVNEPSQIQFIN